MRTLDRNKRVVYVAKRVPNGDTYRKPVKVKVNALTTTEYTDIIAFGDRYMNKMRGVIDARDDVFDVRDKVYVNTKPTDTYDVLAKNADFIVESKSIGLNSNTFILTRTVEHRG
jgi:hypothetical protein